MYWTHYTADPDAIYRADSDGQNEVTFYSQTGYHNPDQLNIYKDEIYFIQAGDPAGRRVFHMKKDGSQATPTKDTSVNFAASCIHIHEQQPGKLCSLP